MRFAVPPPVLAALERLTDRGHQAYLVGGCVRDDLLGIPPHDYDIATSATPDAVKAAFAGEHLLLHGIAHGTVTPVLHGLPVEITTFRKDGAYTDGRHPDEVVFTTSLAEDMARRDFTVNALAWSPDTGLVDTVNGIDDLNARLIRAVGDPERRFSEDALRILRAVRFAGVLGFSVEEETARAMANLAPSLTKISVERIAAEWTGALLGKQVARVPDYPDVVFAALPELAFAGIESNIPRVVKAAEIAQSLPADLPMRWTAMCAGGTPEQMLAAANGSAERLRLSNALRRDIGILAEHAHERLMPDEAGLLLSRLGLPMLLRVVTLQRALAADDASKQKELHTLAARAEQLAASGACTSLRDLAVNGNDLLAAGIPKGPEVGELLGRLMRAVVTGRLPNTRDALLDAAQALRHQSTKTKEQEKNPPR